MTRHTCQWDKCEEFYSTAAGLDKHVVDIHLSLRLNEQVCKWKDCPRKTPTTRTNLKIHIRRHIHIPSFNPMAATLQTEKPLSDLEGASACQWDDCELRFPSPKVLMAHVIEVHIPPRNTKDLNCKWQTCEKEHAKPYPRRDGLLRHLQSKILASSGELEQKAEKTADLSKIVSNTGPDGNRLFVCQWHQCSRTFSTLVDLNTHALSHIKIGHAPICRWGLCTHEDSKISSFTLLKRHISACVYGTAFSLKKVMEVEEISISMEANGTNGSDGSNDLYSCQWQECAKTFSTTEFLANHFFNEHTKEGSDVTCQWRSCYKVGHTYAAPLGLRTHVQNIIHGASGARSVTCYVCGEVLHNLSQFHNHINGQHMLICPVNDCNEEFAMQDPKLGTHMLLHTGGPYIVPGKVIKTVMPKFSPKRAFQEQRYTDEEDFDVSKVDIFAGADQQARAAYCLYRNELYVRHWSHVVMGMRAEVTMPVEDSVCLKCGDPQTTSSAYLHVVSTLNSKIQGVELEFRETCLACWDSLGKRPELCSIRRCTALKVALRTTCEFHAAPYNTQILSVILNSPFKNGKGGKIRTHNEMGLYLERYHLEVPQDIKVAFREIQDASDMMNVYYIDTEYTGNVCTEIAILDARGDTVLNTFVDYGTIPAVDHAAFTDFQTFQSTQIFEGEERVYMSPSAIGRALEKLGVNKSSFLMEWSSSSCDYKNLKRILSLTDFGHVLPAETKSVRCLFPWQKALPGFVSFRLSVLFSLLCPDWKLSNRAHRAEPDAKMLFKVMEIFQKEIFAPVTYQQGGIRGWLKPSF